MNIHSNGILLHTVGTTYMLWEVTKHYQELNLYTPDTDRATENGI
jgi:hypothetical protein